MSRWSVDILGLILLLGLCACMPFGVHERPAEFSMLQAHRGSDTLAFNPGSEELLSAGWEGELILWEPPDYVRHRRWQGHNGYVEGVGFAGSLIVSASRDGVVKIWRGPGRMVHSRDMHQAITEMSMAQDVVLIGYTNGAVEALALPRLSSLWRVDAHSGWVASVAAHPNGQLFASAGADRKVSVYDREGSMQRLPSSPGASWSLVFSSDGAWLYGGGFPELYRWRLADSSLDIVDSPHYGQINGMSVIAPDKAARAIGAADKLVTISRTFDSSIIILDPNNGRELARFQRLELCGNAVAVLPPSDRFVGGLLAATGDAGNIRMWRLDR